MLEKIRLNLKKRRRNLALPPWLTATAGVNRISCQNSTGVKHTTALADTEAAPRRLLQRQRLFVFERPNSNIVAQWPSRRSTGSAQARSRRSASRHPRRGPDARAHLPRTLHAICLQYPITCSWNGGEYSHVIALIDPRTRRQQNTPAGTYEFLFIDFRPQSVFRQLDFPCLSRVTKLNIHVAGFSLTN